MDNLKIYEAKNNEETVEGLVDVLVSCVEGGASVGFMLPLSRKKAAAFWRDVLGSADREERVVLIAKNLVTNKIVGTVQLVLDMPENQPHRADVAKVLVHRSARKKGLGSALVQAVEQIAKSKNRSLLVLDTVTGSDAQRLYMRNGWERVGQIPGFALWPEGGLCSTTIFFRQLPSGSKHS